MKLGVAAALVAGELVPGDVELEGGVVAAVGVGEPRGSKLAAPGLVDLQVNGYAGVDFSVAGDEEYTDARAALLADGVTAFQPTLVSDAEKATVAALAVIGRAAEEDRRGDPDPGGSGARVIGAHLEGPFLSPDRPGAHDPKALTPPDLDTLDRFLAAGPVTQMTLAPELPGAPELIDALIRPGRSSFGPLSGPKHDRAVTVSCGHTDADAPTAHAAFDRGATAVTHLFNAMRPPSARDPGIAYAALGRGDVFITLIVDGHHLADDTVRTAWQAAGERLVLISDAVAAAAAPDGDYTLGGTGSIHSEGGVVRNAAGSLAGSTITMLGAVRTAHGLGIPLAASLCAATEAPARMSRRPDLGRIEPGSRADLIVLDEDLALEQVFLTGIPCR